MIECSNPDEAAKLRLEADVCDMWAMEIEAGDRFGQAAYADAVESYCAAQRGEESPTGGLVFLVPQTIEPALAH